MSEPNHPIKEPSRVLFRREYLLFVILGGFFVANALAAEFIGVKIFSMERLLGFEPFNFTLLGEEGLALNLSAGVLLWPVVFIMTDIINDYYGIRGVRILSWLAAAMIGYSFIMFYLAMGLPAADFWVMREIGPGTILNMDHSFNAVFGQGMWIIVGSLCAFLVGQLIDAYIFARIKRVTGEKRIWIRATVSTLFSQLIDSFLVLFIAFYLGAGWDMRLVLAIGMVNYTYKFAMAVLLIPALNGIHWLIERYLGKELSEQLRKEALTSK